MNTSVNRYDSLEKIIHEDGLRIVALHFHPELDLCLIVLNNKKVLQFNISKFQRLNGQSKEALEKYKLISNGIGVNWPELDEDLSLKGFLREELTGVIV